MLRRKRVVGPNCSILFWVRSFQVTGSCPIILKRTELAIKGQFPGFLRRV